MASVEEEDWRVGLSLLDRFKYMFETKYGSDVEFMVGREASKKLIRAHRTFLVGGSSVFDVMLTNKPHDGGPITVDDVEPDVFNEMLRYLYHESVNITYDNVMDLLYVTKKYLIPGLDEECSTFLDSQLSVHNACKLLEQSLKYEATDLEEKCIELMSDNAKEIMESVEFLSLSNKSLEKFVQSDTLDVIREKEVYDACLRWANDKCREKKLAIDDEHCRAILGPVLYHIRFPTMSTTEFAELTTGSTLLAPTERMSIFDDIALGANVDKEYAHVDKFNRKVRKNKALYVVERHRAHISHQWNMGNGAADAIDVVTDKDIVAEGVGIYGEQSSDTRVVQIKVLDDKGQVLVDTGDTQLTSDASPIPVQVLLPHPVRLTANARYSIVLTSSENFKTFFGQNGENQVTSAGVTFTFHKSSLSKNATSDREGQIPQILFRLV